MRRLSSMQSGLARPLAVTWLVVFGMAVAYQGVVNGLTQHEKFCGSIKEVVDAAGDNFAKIRGRITKAAGGIDFYETPSVKLLGASSCYVAWFPAGDGWNYRCIWESKGPSRQQEYETFAAAVKQCYPGARASSTASSTTVRLDAARIRVARQDDRGQISFSVYPQQ